MSACHATSPVTPRLARESDDKHNDIRQSRRAERPSNISRGDYREAQRFHQKPLITLECRRVTNRGPLQVCPSSQSHHVYRQLDDFKFDWPWRTRRFATADCYPHDAALRCCGASSIHRGLAAGAQ